MKTKLIILFTSCIPLFFVGCNASQEPAEDQAVNTSDISVPNVKVVHPERRNFEAESNVIGTAMPYKQVEVMAMESGYITKMHKDIGDRVKKGEVIASLSNPEINRMLEAAKAEFEAKEATWIRLASIKDKSPTLTTAQMVEEAESAFKIAKANYDNIKDRMGFLRVKAPFNGVITKRFMDEGALVQNGINNPSAAPIFEVQDLSVIRLEVQVPDVDATAAQTGTRVMVTFPEMAGKAFPATISRTSGALSSASKTMQAEIDLENADGMLRPGMYAEVKIQLNSRQNVVSLPMSALVFHQDAEFLWVVKDSIATRMELRRGLSNRNYFEVLNAEIDSATTVVTEGKNLIRENQPVQYTFENEPPS